MGALASEPVRSPRRARRLLTYETLGGVILIAAVLIAPNLISFHTEDLLIQAFCYGVLAISLDLIWGYAGLLSLGQSAFWGLGGYAVGLASTQIADGGLEGLLLGLLLGGTAALLLAALLGWITFYSRVTPIYIAVITLSTALVLQQLASLTSFSLLSDLTGGYNGLSFSSVEWNIDQWYYVSAGLLVVAYIAARAMSRSDFGRVLTGVRDNSHRLSYFGWRVPAVQLMIFTASAVLASVAGAAYGSYVKFVSPDLFGLAVGSYVLILVLVGGRATVVGPVIGALVMGLVGPAISDSYPEWWQLIEGALFILVVVVAPFGLIGILRRGTQMLDRRVPTGLRFASAQRPDSVLVVNAPQRPARDIEPERRLVAKVEGVKRSFGSHEVLRGVDLEIWSHEILCIIGPNGAGKSTLIDALTDTRELQEGTFWVEGEVVENANPASISRRGVGRTFQGTSLMETYTVADSLYVAGRAGRLPSPWRRTHKIETTQMVERLAKATGLDRKLDVEVGELAHGSRQALELALALSVRPSLLLLDEPTAGLTQQERSDVGQLLRELADDGLAIVLIEHDLDFVRDITDRVAVLHQGQVQVQGSTEDVVGSSLVREIYLGAGA